MEKQQRRNKMKNNIKKDSKFIEQWALSAIIDNYNIENSTPINDLGQGGITHFR